MSKFHTIIVNYRKKTDEIRKIWDFYNKAFQH